MAGTWLTNINTRMDSENANSGTSEGTYNAGTKISEAATVIGTATAFTFPAFVAANLQSFFLVCDQGTVANPVVIIITLATGSKTLNMVAGQPYYWDVNNANLCANPFAYNAVSATYNVPTALAVTLANITGRVEVS